MTQRSAVQHGHAVVLPESGRLRGRWAAVHRGLEDAERGAHHRNRAVKHGDADSTSHDGGGGTAAAHLLQVDAGGDDGQDLPQICPGVPSSPLRS